MTEPTLTAPIGLDSLLAVRRSQRRKAIARFVVLVLLPTLVIGVYRVLVQTKFYESSAIVALEVAPGAPGPVDLRRDSLELRDYALSRDVLRILVDQHGYRRHLAAPGVDFLSRVPADAPNDAIYRRYLSNVDVELDTESSFLVLRARAFSRGKAHELAQAIVRALSARASHLGRPDGDPGPALRFLGVVAQPSRPDVPAGPDAIRSILTAFFGCLSLLVIATIVVATIREHADS